ncbi:integrase core domain-containing protein [Streptomyces mirabilis]|uniref:integrase core domain-containing protein n=1 Tax=Streptomyces mirabilis TaxID=68239 RepID=UPI0036A5BD47
MHAVGDRVGGAEFDVAHTYIKPRTPRLNGKVERSHRIDAEEFYRLLDGVVVDDAEVFNDKLREWEDYYNYHRPHGGLGGQTPYERLKQKTTTQAYRSSSIAHRDDGHIIRSRSRDVGHQHFRDVGGRLAASSVREWCA